MKSWEIVKKILSYQCGLAEFTLAGLVRVFAAAGSDAALLNFSLSVLSSLVFPAYVYY